MRRAIPALAMAYAVAASAANPREPALTPTVGPVEIYIALPHAKPGTAEPLLETGRAGHGDTVFILFEREGLVRFGWDSSMSGVVFSPPVPVVDAVWHRLLVSMGSLQPDASPGAPADSPQNVLRQMLVVGFDGRTVLRREGTFGAIQSGDEIALGKNRVGAAIVRPFFTGRLGALIPVAPARALADALNLGRWVAAPGAIPGWPGAVRMSVRFPREPSASGDPLVVTGRTGVGDFLYTQTLDSGHVRFGFDHWAVGGASSSPVQLDLSAVHEIVLTLGALYDPEGKAGKPWRDNVAVWLDRRLVFETESAFHPTTPAQIVLGYNLIGGSTTGYVFRGQILGAEPVSEQELDAMPR